MTRDNVFVERLWRSVKYEEVYLHAYHSVSAAREGIGSYLDLYNRRRPHSSLDGRTPDRAYFGHQSMPPIRLAAYPDRRSTYPSGDSVRTTGAASSPPEGVAGVTSVTFGVSGNVSKGAIRIGYPWGT